MQKRKEEIRIRGIWERVPGSGVWWIRYRDADGKLHREKVGRKGHAVDLLNKRRNDKRIGVKLPDNLRSGGLKFKVLLDDVETFSKAHHKDQRNILSRLRRIRPDFEERIADQIKPEEIDLWLAKNTNSAATYNRYRALFSLAFREGLHNGKVRSNPARLVKQKHEENGVIRWLKEDEEKALRHTITKHHPEHMPELDIALGTGMRLSEQYGLTWQAIDLTRKEIKLAKTKNYNARVIPMNSTVQAAFTELHSRVSKAKKSDAVLPHSPRKWWEDAIEKSGLTDFRWHDMRHTFCSRLAMKSVNLKVIQVLAGHKTIAMTARYAHLDDAALRAAVDLIASK
jgi:site-specific recombinase XerD